MVEVVIWVKIPGQTLKFKKKASIYTTLDSGINVAPWINVAPGTFGKNNKHSPLKKQIPLNQITELQLFLWITLFNRDVAPGKNSKN